MQKSGDIALSHSIIKQISDFTYNFPRKFSGRILFSILIGAMCNSILMITALCPPSKIIYVVILTISVDMATFQTIRSGANKCFQNEAMDIFWESLAILTKIYLQISKVFTRNTWFHNFCWFVKNISNTLHSLGWFPLPITPYSSKTTDFITRIIRYCFPNFSGDVKIRISHEETSITGCIMVRPCAMLAHCMGLFYYNTLEFIGKAKELGYEV